MIYETTRKHALGMDVWISVPLQENMHIMRKTFTGKYSPGNFTSKLQ